MINSNTPPGKVFCASGTITLNAGRTAKTLTVANTGDRPIQIGSHFHFFEVNRALKFDRAEAYGLRLDVPAGTSVRFEPGDTKAVTLVEIAGERNIRGLNGLVNGTLDAPNAKAEALKQMQTFAGEEHGD